MKNRILILLLLLAICPGGYSQTRSFWNPDEKKVLLLEKIGSHKKFIYEAGDLIKLKTKDRAYYYSYLWDYTDTSMIVGQSRPIAYRNIAVIYPQFQFPRKFGMYMFITGGVYFGILTINHLINNERVFTNDMFIVPAVFFGTGFISISLSERRCPVGEKWKLKVLNVKVL